MHSDQDNLSDARLCEVRDDDNASNMYTPGICADPPDRQRRRNEDTPPEHKRGNRGTGLVLKAVCLALACVLISVAASFGIMEYRIQKGDFPIIHQFVVSENGEDSQSFGIAPASVPASPVMSAEDIYDMARYQVVGIRAGNASARGFFGRNDSPAVNGSGFIISNDGHILTNFHVIEAAYTNSWPIIVHLEDGETHEAAVIGFESISDVAVIKIDAYGLNAVTIANSDSIRVGQQIYAVGNPFGTLVHTMTDGIISALDRVVTIDNKIINTFQLSAAVNSGNSGGPVYDVRGEVIGIVTAKFRNAEIEGVGFAIPINDAIEIAESLIEHGYISGRPFIGITPQTVTRGYAEFFGWVEGVYVRSVVQDSAAEKAGLLFGDIIIKLGEDRVTTREALEFTMRKFKAGDTAMVTVWRGGEEIELTITFDEAQSTPG